MQKTALLSYLLYEDGKITIDEISPKDRFGILYNNNTQFTSASVGKSLVSYVTGHAICEGYIDGVDARINDSDEDLPVFVTLSICEAPAFKN